MTGDVLGAQHRSRRHADLRDVIAQPGLTQLWTELEDELRASLRIQPMIISNGDESGWLMPAHLATRGFYILRVRSNLVEIRLVRDRWFIESHMTAYRVRLQIRGCPTREAAANAGTA